MTLCNFAIVAAAFVGVILFGKYVLPKLNKARTK